MKKRLRSRVLAAGMVGSTLFCAGTILYVQSQAVRAEDAKKPTPADQLARGSELYEKQQYPAAKKILLDIDPAQLPEEQRTKLADLIKQTDMALAKTAESTTSFDNAKAAMDEGNLVQAAKLFGLVAESPDASPELKQNAKIQLALVREKQREKAPAMKALLKDAIDAYDAGRLDDAQTALHTIENTGSDLGWFDNGKPAKYERLIAEKRVALANAAAVATATPPAPATVPAPTTTVAVAPVAPVATAPATTSAPAPAVAGAPDNTLMSEYISNMEIQRQRTMTLYDNAMRNSAASLAKNDFVSAADFATQARVTVNSNRSLFSEADYQQLLANANAQLERVNATSKADQATREAAAREQAGKDEIARSARLKVERQKQVDRLMAEAMASYDQQQYKQSADLLRHVLVVDPTNNYAKFLLRQTEDRINYREWQRLVDRRSDENVKQMLQNQDQLIPYSELLIYPENWPELSRLRQGQETAHESEANRKVRDRLDADIEELSATQQTLEKVLDFLRENQKVNISTNWKALEGAGIDRNTTVSVNLHNVPFRKALNTVLSEVGGGTANLGYTIDDGVITISTRDDLSSTRYQVVRVFDIRDMLVQPNAQVSPPTFNLQEITRGGQTTGGQGGGGQQGMGQQGIFNQTQQQQGTPAQSRDEVVKNILTTIQSTVAPDTWRDAGGTIGSIKELNGQLIVNQTVDNQAAVYNLLQQLRETRALQIAIEARLLLVSNNFLDDFGFGWSLAIPAGNLGGNVQGIPAEGALPGERPPVVISNNTFNQAVAPPSGVPGSLGGGALGGNALDISAQILDSWTLNLLLRATQADKRTTTVTTPRVTLFNGQRAYIAVTQQQNFVSNFSQQVANGGFGGGAVGSQLTVGTLSTGVVLDVEATVSADRRYVVMKLSPSIASLDGIDTFGTVDAGGNTTSSSQSSTQTQSGVFIQLPKISLTQVDTMVSVPDGGTLLIGGQKMVGEAEIEVGVPILSKIPGLNRLFTNRSYVKDERTLLVLVRPKIIIQREEEYKTFGVNYDMAPPSTPGAGSSTGGGTVGAPAAPPAGGAGM